MVRIKKDVTNVAEGTKFMARANVNFALPVNMYPTIRKYNQEFLDRLKEFNGDSVKLPNHMAYRSVLRGDILQFGDVLVADEETGNISVYPREVFDDLSKHTVELPCLMRGVVSEVKKTLGTLMTPKMKEALKDLKDESARFNVKPFLELYTGNEPDLD